MVYPELKQIYCPDLQPPNLPENPADCEVLIKLRVGAKDGDEPEEMFSFFVVTPSRLQRLGSPTWGRGRLIVTAFDWTVVAHALAALFADSARPTWREVASDLGRALVLEAETQRPTDA